MLMRNWSHAPLTWLTVAAIQSVAIGAELDDAPLELVAVAYAPVEEVYGLSQQPAETLVETQMVFKPQVLSVAWIDAGIDTATVTHDLGFKVLEFVSYGSLDQDPWQTLRLQTSENFERLDLKVGKRDPWSISEGKQLQFPAGIAIDRGRNRQVSSGLRTNQINPVAAKPTTGAELVTEDTAAYSVLHYSAPILAIAIAFGMIAVILRKH